MHTFPILNPILAEMVVLGYGEVGKGSSVGTPGLGVGWDQLPALRLDPNPPPKQSSKLEELSYMTWLSQQVPTTCH